MLRRSPTGSAASSSAAVVFSTATDSPVSAASSTVRLIDWSSAGVGRNAIARADDDDVAWHQLARGNDHFVAIAHHACGRCGHLPQGFERPAGAVFLDEAEHHGEQHDDRDDRGFERVAEETGEDRGAQQDQDQDVLELVRERLPCRDALRVPSSSFGPCSARRRAASARRQARRRGVYGSRPRLRSRGCATLAPPSGAPGVRCVRSRMKSSTSSMRVLLDRKSRRGRHRKKNRRDPRTGSSPFVRRSRLIPWNPTEPCASSAAGPDDSAAQASTACVATPLLARH